MAGRDDRLLRALREPASVQDLDAAGWNDLIWGARRHGVLARLAIAVEEAGVSERVPEKARELFADARAAAEFNQTRTRFEVDRVVRAFDGTDVPVILLKGGAYLMAALPPSRGRVCGDLDILVPRERLAVVEQALEAQGWESTITDPYDARYYRAWSHQIPPMRHRDRGTELDVHHTIAPPTSRAAPDAGLLLGDARPLADGRVMVLAPADMVLHSAVHLFNEDLAVGLRDLLDMHDLLGHFAEAEGFWPELLARARRHGLERPLYYCLRYTERFYGTRVPAPIKSEAEAFAPNRLVRAAMDRLVPLAMLPEAPDRRGRAAGLARWLLYVRSHWLRMPPGLLARHLVVKAVRRAAHPGRSAPALQP
ncbi:MAG: nucleotidyltransferase family protein [Kiloniellaceae bacterium]